jgi:hypothetical protein
LPHWQSCRALELIWLVTNAQLDPRRAVGSVDN